MITYMITYKTSIWAGLTKALMRKRRALRQSSGPVCLFAQVRMLRFGELIKSGKADARPAQISVNQIPGSSASRQPTSVFTSICRRRFGSGPKTQKFRPKIRLCAISQFRALKRKKSRAIPKDSAAKSRGNAPRGSVRPLEGGRTF
jgi:hypothetical protein